LFFFFFLVGGFVWGWFWFVGFFFFFLFVLFCFVVFCVGGFLGWLGGLFFFFLGLVGVFWFVFFFFFFLGFFWPFFWVGFFLFWVGVFWWGWFGVVSWLVCCGFFFFFFWFFGLFFFFCVVCGFFPESIANPFATVSFRRFEVNSPPPRKVRPPLLGFFLRTSISRPSLAIPFPPQGIGKVPLLFFFPCPFLFPFPPPKRSKFGSQFLAFFPGVISFPPCRLFSVRPFPEFGRLSAAPPAFASP